MVTLHGLLCVNHGRSPGGGLLHTLQCPAEVTQ